MGFLKDFFGGKKAPAQPLHHLVSPPTILTRSDLGPLERFWHEQPQGYLYFLRMNGAEASTALTTLADVLRSADESSPYIERMLQDGNWRQHLVACAAVLLSCDSPHYASALWSAFDAGSWVAPQLAVTLLLADTHFDGEAHQRVADRCRVASEGPRSLPDYVRAKNFASLIGSLSGVPHENEWVRSELEQPDVRALMLWDRDHAAGIARSWLDAVRMQLAQVTGNLNRSVPVDH